MKSALVIGASRGIGRQVALTLGAHGYDVGIAAKTVDQTTKLPGTIYSVSEEVASLGVKALPIKCDARSASDIDNAVTSTIRTFGRLDYVIYNAGAILWRPVSDTPLKRFDLMHQVNVRGAYAMIQSVLPHFLEQKQGRILLVSPPIYSRFFKGKTPYSVTKVAMTILVHGLANELADTGVSISALWPATTTESNVTDKLEVPANLMRNSKLFAEAVYAIGAEKSEKYNGKALIDEDLMRELGVTDFSEYRIDPDAEPPRIMPRKFPSLRVAEEDEKPVGSKL